MVRGRTLAVLAAAYWAYFTNGVLNSIIGPALLGMVHTFHIDLAAAGAIVTAQFIGYVPGALGSGLAAEHWGHRQVLVAAMVLTTAGALGTALAGAWVVVLLLTPVAGIGFGISDSLCNAVVAHATQGAQGATMNLLHMFFGVGALAGPLLAGVLLSSPVGWQGIFAVTGALAAVAALAFLVVPLPARSRRDADPVRQAPSIARGKATGSRTIRRSAPLWLLAGLLLLITGMAQLVGAWCPTYLTHVQGADLDTAARSVSVYWAFVTLGRLMAGGAAVRWSGERLLGAAALISLGALIALALAHGVGQALFALGLTGLGFAAIYPTVMAITAREYPRRFAALAGAMAAAGGVGGLAYPWLGGIVGQAWGLRATVWLAAILAAALLVTFVLLTMTLRKKRPVWA